MDCPYQSNAFCGRLTAQQRAVLCNGHCHLRTYGKDQRMSYRYWENTVAILLDGLMIFGECRRVNYVSQRGINRE